MWCPINLSDKISILSQDGLESEHNYLLLLYRNENS